MDYEELEKVFPKGFSQWTVKNPYNDNEIIRISKVSLEEELKRKEVYKAQVKMGIK